MPNRVAQVVTFILSLIVGGALCVFLLPLGLMVPLFILFPLLLGVVALLSSLIAAWISAPLVANQSYSRLLPVVGIAEITAACLAVVLLLFFKLVGQVLLPIILLFGVFTLIIVSSANWATWRYRSTERALTKDILVTAGMVALGGFVFVGVYLFSARLGLIGP
ncbi:MAG: hypothetical protein GY832_12135 [Chloroflexi bacterium]|nr:hypothetical protein [Chloroflexota bacterium]